ncbi:hypothetical protein RhiirA4_485361 [Rhizophagus irregularis]|uniref:Uncharacterized protein n=1 Tax=Rhizophagus irregularis TaxID=588596 RepID=A0A2I1HQ27_9GLOM|nr:hypothetical protein RhiirA4_485361 [Rhizophagus irregularis]
MFDTTNLLFDISETNSRHTFYDNEIVGLKQLAKLKQQKRWKMIYAYDEITDENWLKYKEETTKLLDDEPQPIIRNVNDLNRKWINFRKKLINLIQQSCNNRKSRDTIIKQKKIVLNRKKSNYFKESKSYQYMCFIRNLRRKLKRILKTQKEGSFNINHMNEIKLASTILTNDNTLTNIVLYLEELKKLNNLLIIQYKAELIQYRDIQMKDYIQERSGSTNQEKILSGIWIDQYSLRDYVEINIYDGLMDHITQEEIEYHISLLPNGKASGPSRVSYKMIKHSNSEMKTYIKDYLNECLTLKKIPKEWKIADLYIPYLNRNLGLVD